MTFLSFSIQDADSPSALREALSEADSAAGLQNIVRQTFFVSERVNPQLIECALSDVYGQAIPPTTYVGQPPATGADFSAELWALSSRRAPTRQGRVSVASWGAATWAFMGGYQTGEAETPYDGVHRILRNAHQDFACVGCDFRKVVRTWYYIGNILGSDGAEIRYDRVNRARNEFYRDKWPDLRLSPASTGIGMNTNRVALDGFALSGAPSSVKVLWIDNPLQTPPSLYEIQADADRRPSFSRAAAVRFPDATVLFVSGTASIRGSEVVRPGDAEAQTEVTIENIATLIGEKNLVRKYGLHRGATLRDMQQFRVYVKRASDLAAVEACCRRHLPEVPQSYLFADICRQECLVEIEGIAAFHHRGGGQET